MSLADLDAEPVFRSAYRLGQVAGDVRTAADRTAGAYPDHWSGDAGIAYQRRLDETADRVRRVAVAYDVASAALVPYARALLDVVALEQRAASLLAEAEDADRRSAAVAAVQGVERLAGPSPAEAFRAAAARLSAEAAEVERRAAAICAAALEDTAARAPRTSGWRSVDRFVGDLTRVGVDSVVGAASLLDSAWHALPGIGSPQTRHEGRRGLVDAAVAAAEIWTIPGAVRDAWEDGRYGLAVGTLAGVVGPGKLEMHRIRDPFLAHKEAFREADRRAALAGHMIWRPSAAEMGRNGVSLLNEEARGGHVLERHVGASRGFLRLRVLRETRRAGTFRDLPTAEVLVNDVLRRHSHRIAETYRLDRERYLRLTSEFDVVTGAVMVRGSSTLFAARSVTVVLGLEEGEPVVYTAFPEL